MGDILIILLAVAAVKFVLFGIILLVVFKPDFKRLWAGEEAAIAPTCLYCGSKWTEPVEEGETRWEGDDLVLVTTYECQHCHLPFWHVERVPTASQQEKAKPRPQP